MNNITMMSVDDIIPYDKNPRNNEGAVDKVAASIREFGFKQPIVVDKDNVVVIGHGRLLAENCFLSTKKEEHYALCL